jgi:hypothetical protein
MAVRQLQTDRISLLEMRDIRRLHVRRQRELLHADSCTDPMNSDMVCSGYQARTENKKLNRRKRKESRGSSLKDGGGGWEGGVRERETSREEAEALQSLGSPAILRR